MNAVAVVGGVYGEECAFPLRKQIFGSAGRAAIALSSGFENVTLHTLIPDHVALRVLPIFDSHGVNVVNRNSDQFISFEYLHCLADPQIYPRTNKIRQQTSFHVESELVVQFGMMECRPTVDAGVCVYDPQSPTNPLGFRDSGSKARRLAFVANSGEIELLTDQNIDDGAHQLLQLEAAEVVIVKCGLHGARIYEKSGFAGSVPAYQAENVFTIGSGDIFVAAFAKAWGKQGLKPLEAAEFASRSVASYVENENCPLGTIEEVSTVNRSPVRLKKGSVYLAGPFRELGQRVIVDEARKVLLGLGMTVFSPVQDIGHGPASIVVGKDLQAIRDCDAVFAILNGSSPGTLFEVGYAIALGKPVYCVAQNMRPNDTKLPEGAGCSIHSDLISATHLLAWRA